MNKKRVLLTGGSGLLALNWACAMRGSWNVILGTHLHRVALRGVDATQLDLNTPENLGRQLDELAPDLVIHTAGLTNVDLCEKHPALALEVNARIARNLAAETVRRNLKLVHISTDHLFAGEQAFYREEAPPCPLNEYAKSKLFAEDWVKQIDPGALILRTNFFGWGSAYRQSFSDWIIYSLREGKALTLFDDVFVTPILADRLAEAAHELVARGTSGTVNLVGDERLSKYDFALKVARHFNLPAELIRRAQVTAAKLDARRPNDMSLDNTKARRILTRELGTVDDYLAALHQQELGGRRDELLLAVSPVESE